MAAVSFRAGVELRQFPLLPARDTDLLLLSLFANGATPVGGAFASWNAPLAIATRRGQGWAYRPICSGWLAGGLLVLGAVALLWAGRSPGRRG